MLSGRFKHMGTEEEFDILCVGFVRVDNKLRNYDPVVIYRSVDDDRVWVRAVGDFVPRFEQVETPITFVDASDIAASQDQTTTEAPCVGGAAAGADVGHMERLRASIEVEGLPATSLVPNAPLITGDGGELFAEVVGLREANVKLTAQLQDLALSLEDRDRLIDNLRGASRDVPIRMMSDDEARRYVMLAQVNLAEAVRHIAEAWLARGGTDGAVALATRCRLNVAKASAYLDGENWVPPRDVKG